VNDILADQLRTPSGGRQIPDLGENHGPGRHRTEHPWLNHRQRTAFEKFAKGICDLSNVGCGPSSTAASLTERVQMPRHRKSVPSPRRTPSFCRVRSGGISRRFLASRGAASEADIGAARSEERRRYDW